MRKTALCFASFLAGASCGSVRADGPFALVSGRWAPTVTVVDLGKALDPVNDAPPNAIVSRVRVTRDVDTDGDLIPDTPAAGLPSNVVIDRNGRTAYVVNHAGYATAAEAAEFAHGHAGTIVVLDLGAALDPANDQTTNAIAAVIPSGGYGPVGFAQSPDGRSALVGSSEGEGNEDGGTAISVVDLTRREVTDVLHLPLGNGGKVAQDPDRSCAELLAQPSRAPRGLPNGNVGCFPDINAIGVVGHYAFTANGGTDDVSVVDLQRAIEGSSDVEVARIAVERGPWGLAVSPDERLIAVTNRESAETGLEGNTISIVNVERATEGHADAEVARVVVGTDDGTAATRPFGLAFTPDGRRIVVANFRGNNVSIVDVGRALAGDEGAELARLPLARPDAEPSRPRGVAITPDGRYAVISGGPRDAAGGGTLWLIDLDSAAVVAVVTGVGNEPYLLAIAGEPSEIG